MNKKMVTRPITASIYLMNIIAAFYIVNEQYKLIGDLSGFKSSPDVIAQSIILITLSLIFLSLLFDSLEKIKPLFNVKTDNSIAIAIIIFEVSFISYVYTTGYFIAGNIERAGSILSAIFVIINVDVLVLVFLTHCKKSKFKKIIVLLWVISFLQRGWISYLFILIILFFVDQRLRKIKLNKIYIFTTILILCLPFVENIKNNIRSGVDNDNYITYVDSLGAQFLKVVGRVQTLSHVSFILDNSDKLQQAKNNEQSTDFYEENFANVFIKKVSEDYDKINTSDLLAKFISPELDSAWNVNPSLIGWVIIQDDFYIIPIIWIILLCLMFTLLSKAISDDEYTMNMRWILWLIFLFPGWIFQFSSVIFSFGVYLFIGLILKKMRF